MERSFKRALALIIAMLMTASCLAVSEEPLDIEIADNSVSVEGGSVEVDFIDDVDLSGLSDGIQIPGNLDLEGTLETQDAQTVGETPVPVPFDQSEAVDGVQFTITAEAGAFPAGASLCVTRIGDETLARTVGQAADAILQGTGRRVHHLYAIEVLDAENKPCLPNNDMPLPLVTVRGLILGGTAHVFVYNADTAICREIEANQDDAIQFHFVDSSVYDLVELTPGRSEGEEQPEQSVAESRTEQPADDEQTLEMQQPADEVQEQNADGLPSDEQLPTDDMLSLNDIEVEQPASGDSEDQSAAGEDAEAGESVPFEQSRTVSGVVVTVRANPSVFPANAVLSVEYVPKYQAREADEAVDDVRDERRNVAVSYTFDIKVIDPETGSEIQPVEGSMVNVSFALAEVADENLETQVYHISEDEKTGELSAESLDVEQKVTEDTGVESTAEVRTDGFSLYILELTYDDLAYAMQDDSVALSEVLASFGLTGEVSAVEVSDKALFSAEKAHGQWMLTAHRSFDAAQMNVTVNGVAYGIAVSNAVSKMNITYLDRHAIGFSVDALVELDDTVEAIRLSTETANTLSGKYYVVDTDITWDKAVSIDGTVNLILKNGITLNARKGIVVPQGSTLHIYGQKGDSGKLVAKGDDSAGIGGEDKKNTGKIYIHGGTIEATGDKLDAGIGGSKNASISDITIYGGNITANGGKGGAGIGTGYVGGDMAPITIFGGNIKAIGGRNYDNGGEDDECGAGIGGGCYTNCGTVTIYGGTIYAEGKNNSAAIGGGGDDEPYRWYEEVNGAGGDVSVWGGKVTVKSVSNHAQCHRLRRGRVPASRHAAPCLRHEGDQGLDAG